MKKFLSLIIALVLTMSVFAVFPVFAEDTVYDVGTAAQLDAAIEAINQMSLETYVADGNTNGSKNVVINLTADIVYNEDWTSDDLFAYATTGTEPANKTETPTVFTPLGSAINTDGTATPFMGRFNGNGYTISGLCVRRVRTSLNKQHEAQGAALIAFSKGATVNNVTIDRSAFFANEGCVGTIIGNSYQGANTVSKINVSDVQLKNAASGTGGIIGVNYKAGTSISDVKIDASVSGTDKLGGVVGETTVQMSISNVNADVTVNGTSTAVGGIVGYNKTDTLTVNNVYVEGTVSSTYEVSSAKVYVGGVCGQNDSNGTLNLTNAVVAADVTGQGFVGSALGAGTSGGKSNITNCFASGDVTATSQKAGGIVGCVNSAGATTLKNCAYVGTATSGNSEKGPIFGFNYNTSVTATACYGFKKDSAAAATGKLYGGCGSGSAATVTNSNVDCKTRDELAAIIDGWGKAATNTFTNSTVALGALFNNTVVGIQTGYDKAENGTRAVRFIATIDATDFREVGFIIKMTRPNGNDGTESVTVEKGTTSVYKSINSVSESTPATEFGSQYLTAIGVNNLDSVSELTFEVSSYVITLDGKKYTTDVKTVEYENKNEVIYINGKEEK